MIQIQYKQLFFLWLPITVQRMRVGSWRLARVTSVRFLGFFVFRLYKYFI